MIAARERRYDEVFDAQRHFRLLLDSMAHPGAVRSFEDLPLMPPPEFAPAAAAVALALLDANASWFLAGYASHVEGYLAANTSSRAASSDEADFLFLNALAAAPEATCEAMSRARIGQPAYPEEGATLVLQVARLAPNADGEPGSLRVSVSGPGVDGVARFAAEGLPPVVLRALRSINREYPLGVETILAAGERVVSLPRSAAVDWE